MKDVVGITLNDNGRVYYFDPNKYKLKKNVTVIVETDQGQQFGRVVQEQHEINEKELIVKYLTSDDFDEHILKNWDKALLIPMKIAHYLNKDYKFIINSQIIDYKKLLNN